MIISKALFPIVLVGAAILAVIPACGSNSDSATSTSEKLYNSNCSSCHGAQGSGDIGIGPNISGSTKAGIGSWTGEQFLGAVRTGMDDEGKKLCPQMPQFSKKVLTDAQIASIHDFLSGVVNDKETVDVGCD